MRKSPIGSLGFTLLELLLALSIGSIVLTAVYGTFHTAIKAKQRAEKSILPLRRAHYFFSALKKDLQLIPANTKVSDIDCQQKYCKFMILDQTGSFLALSYELNSKKEIIKKVFKETTGKQEHEFICSNVSSLSFIKEVNVDKKENFAKVLLKININFNSQPEPIDYEYALLIESALQP